MTIFTADLREQLHGIFHDEVHGAIFMTKIHAGIHDEIHGETFTAKIHAKFHGENHDEISMKINDADIYHHLERTAQTYRRGTRGQIN